MGVKGGTGGILGGKGRGGAQLLDELFWMLSMNDAQHARCGEDLLEGFVIDEACPVFGNVELALLEVFTELPGWRNPESGRLIRRSHVSRSGASMIPKAEHI